MSGRKGLDLPSGFSDGRQEYWPTSKEYIYQPGDRLYHEKLAAQWMVSHPIPADTGKSYSISFSLQSPSRYIFFCTTVRVVCKAL
jgi:hypothetical protein